MFIYIFTSLSSCFGKQKFTYLYKSDHLLEHLRDKVMAEEAEYAMARTSVWWDIENCSVPKGWDAHGIAQNISSALMKMNYCGPLSISSYGNTNLIPNFVQQALSSTGIALNHVPSSLNLLIFISLIYEIHINIIELRLGITI